jgi:hypothetical protein
VILEETGSFLPSKLHGEFVDAGIDVLGVTCTEEDGQILAVQIHCGGDVDEKLVAKVCEAHDPAPPEQPPSLVDAIAGALEQLPKTASAADVKNAIVEALQPFRAG